MRTPLFLFFTVLIFVLASCGNEEHPINDHIAIPDVELVDTEVDSLEYFEESDEFEFIAPSPIEIVQVFKSSELLFNASNTNPASNAGNYQTKFKKSLNFGCYATDLAYCTVNEETQQAQEYFAVLKKLGDEIGLGTIFEEEMANRFKNNLGSMDSLVNILSEVQLLTDEYIEMYGEDELQVIYFSGAWLEGMYLGVKSIQQSTRNSNDPLIVEKLAKEIELGNEVYQGLSSIDKIDPEIEELQVSIEQIISTYYEFESVKDQIKQDLPIPVQLSGEEVDQISGLIVEAREQMIQ